ncbi:MAG: class I SAM-dependent methyltransferase [Variovorax sp.]|nr:MAG: class I SAM-dependent methyltransferase [Variovorax sp.]
MTAFSADWLALREPFDHAARSEAAPALDLRAVALRLRGSASVLGVIDLACGTGANLRALAPRLGGSQRWLMVDHDPALLSTLPDALGAWARSHGFILHADAERLRIEGQGWDAELRPLRIDLALAMDAVPFAEAQLVTASALLDLVSASWLDTLLRHASARNAAMLFALTVDGRTAWEPGMAGDAEVHALFTEHQCRDKGFGAALGAEAVAFAAQRLSAAGYRVTQARSDWCIDASAGPDAVAMANAMIEGMAAAALEQDPTAGVLVSEWRARRLAAMDRSRLRVGHLDVLAMP